MHHSSSKRIGRVAFLLEVVADGRQLQGQASVYELTEKSIISDAVTYERTRDATGELAEQRNGWGHVTQESLAKERRLPMTSRVAPILENAHGPVVEVAFAGGYPEGSPGNRVAADMSAVVARAVETLTPAAVIFDLVGLRYTWGDAICSIVMPLETPGRQLYAVGDRGNRANQEGAGAAPGAADAVGSRRLWSVRRPRSGAPLTAVAGASPSCPESVSKRKHAQRVDQVVSLAVG